MHQLTPYYGSVTLLDALAWRAECRSKQPRRAHNELLTTPDPDWSYQFNNKTIKYNNWPLNCARVTRVGQCLATRGPWRVRARP